MPRAVVLLRGINLGPRNRIPMKELRELLGEAGYGEVRTYVQSGNIVLESDQSAEEIGRQVERLIAERFDLDIPVVVRTQNELAQVVKRNPLAKVATDPKRYQVSFLDTELDAEKLEELKAVATESEQLVARGRELYAWHPDGVARS
ncbi:MAG: DUF1697 domain-containing protein, partial [Solirubrobacterales bacterium]|nr:DUF1697 domain-containing protein [Solirubrobacterales bacterium]